MILLYKYNFIYRQTTILINNNMYYAILQVSLFSIASLMSFIVAKHPPVSTLLTIALARYPVVIE